MTQLTWQTPAGSLGIIPEGVFFKQTLSVSVPYQIIPANCTGTSLTNNLITCDTTLEVTPGLTVRFFGETFGGLIENTNYFVFSVPSSTTFSVATSLDASRPVALTDATGVMTARFGPGVFYRLQAGTLPQGIQIASNGLMEGVPTPMVLVQGVPLEVSQNITSKFTIRAYTQRTVRGVVVIDSIADRTFTLTVTGNDVPDFITPAGSIGTFYDGDQVEIQIEYTEIDLGDEVLIRLISGQLPLGLKLSSTGRIHGYIRPFPDVNKPPGYDLTSLETEPYDFISSAISKNYQFILEITDGKSSNLRTYTIYVYNRDNLKADDTYITADTTFVTADRTPNRAPFLLNAEPSNIGIIRSENNFAYRFVGEDYDTEQVEYAISVNQGFGFPPGLELDPYSGWYYGTIPDVGITETTYSFFIQVRSRSVVCSSTQAAGDVIICDTATRADLYVGAAVRFEGTSIGGITLGQTYYVSSIVGDTQFQISESFLGTVFNLTNGTIGANQYLFCVPNDISASQLYPFSLTIAGNIDREVIWQTDADLGAVENGSVSLLRIQAENRGGRDLVYELASGAFNELPQGLTLLPTGEISGRVTFNTFSVDLGATTFDRAIGAMGSTGRSKLLKKDAIGESDMDEDYDHDEYDEDYDHDEYDEDYDHNEYDEEGEAAQDTITRLEPTTVDSTFRFTVNAYAEDTSQPLFKVSAVKVIDGGQGYVSTPSITFSEPVGAAAIQAAATVTVQGGVIQAINVTNPGAGYTGTAGFTVTGVGTGADLRVIMQSTGVRRVVSAFKTFTVRVVRAYNKPYQNLYIVAMPPDNDRALLESLLTDTDIFVPEYIYRPDDPYFGVSQRVQYEHAVGLAPEQLLTYVQSLDLNHYWKNLVLGPIQTARAVDSQGQIIYEVVYCPVIDNLVNDQGRSVSKIVTLPYAIRDPRDGSTVINSVYPNSLINMRDQVVDVVGQISQKLPLWMTSRQENGQVLGFTPAWIVCYTNPGRSRQIAYYIDTQFGQRFNTIDFKVDRYVLDSSMSRNWDSRAQSWTPAPNLTTFDRIDTAGFTELGTVNVCTELALFDVNGRTIEYINSLGGLDGFTRIAVPGQTPPPGTKIILREGSKIIFVKQESFDRFPNTNDAFIENITWYDENGFDSADTDVTPGSYDYGVVVPGGSQSICIETAAATDTITADSTLGMIPGNKVWFTGTTFGGISRVTNSGATQVYYVHSVASVTGTATFSILNTIVVDSTADLAVDDQVWFPDQTIGGIPPLNTDGVRRAYYILSITGNQIQIGTTPGGSPVLLTNESGDMTINLKKFSVSQQPNAPSPLALSNDTGVMAVNYDNNRMAIYTIHILNDGILELELDLQTVANDYVTSSQGSKYPAGALLYHPGQPVGTLSRVNWQPLIAATAVITLETTFDHNSLQFIEPVDMYDPTDEYDKYLVFPKINILA
jgi:hypothetical protein